MVFQRFLSTGFFVFLLGALAAPAAAQSGDSNRQVQFASIDFVAGVLELHNFGDVVQPLDGWRFCTADEDQVLRYTTPSGLDGLVIAPGASLFIYMNNDAPVGDPNAINRSVTGADFLWALPFDQNAYGMGLYFLPAGSASISFAVGAQMVDYVQWGDANAAATMADIRAVAAEGEVWMGTDQFVLASPATTRLVLRPAALVDGTTIDTPNSYAVIEEPADCSAAGGNADADTFCDDEDPCPVVPNSANSSDLDGNGIPDDCQCGDANFSGSVEADDLFDVFRCLTTDSQALFFPCSQVVFKGDTNLAQSGAPVFESADLFEVFQAQTDVSRRANLTCLARPVPGPFEIPQ